MINYWLVESWFEGEHHVGFFLLEVNEQFQWCVLFCFVHLRCSFEVNLWIVLLCDSYQLYQINDRCVFFHLPSGWMSLWCGPSQAAWLFPALIWIQTGSDWVKRWKIFAFWALDHYRSSLASSGRAMAIQIWIFLKNKLEDSIPPQDLDSKSWIVIWAVSIFRLNQQQQSKQQRLGAVM